jgi:hypothetical protein
MRELQINLSQCVSFPLLMRPGEVRLMMIAKPRAEHMMANFHRIQLSVALIFATLTGYSNTGIGAAETQRRLHSGRQRRLR